MYVILVLGAISLILTGMMVFGSKEVTMPEVTVPEPKITASDKQDIATLVVQQMPAPTATTATAQEVIVPAAELSAEDQARLKEASSYDEKQKALELVTEEMATKDFKKSIMAFLNDESTSIENYKDVKDVTVKDSDVEVDHEEGTVTVTFKVNYFNDGDDDASDMETAKVKVTFNVAELNEDKDFEDAEIQDGYDDSFELVKIYEK